MTEREELYRPELEAAPVEAWLSQQDELARAAFENALAHAPELSRRLARAGVRLDAVGGVSDLEAVPVLSKDDLPELQDRHPPFGGLLAVPETRLRRVYLSPGPILDPEGEGPDFWGFAPALFAAGFREGQRAYNTFSYHLTPAGAMMEEALFALGCSVVPGGVGATEAQVDFLRRSGATGYCGTPSFLLILCDRARASGVSLPLERGFVSGAPLSTPLRVQLEEDHGLSVLQGYGTADAGALGYECGQRDGWHVAPGRVIEIVDPATGARLPEGETGEVVVTSPNQVYPLVRFGTGDLTALESEPCACGRTTPRLLGFRGRVGEGVKVRGQFVHPHGIERALRAAVGEPVPYRAVVTERGHRDEILVRVAAEGVSETELARRLSDALRVRVDVRLVTPSDLDETEPPIRDERRWD